MTSLRATFFPVLALGPIVEHLLQGTGLLF